MQTTQRNVMATVITRVKAPIRSAEARWPVLRFVKRPARFGLVGASGVVVNTLVLSALVWMAGLPIWLASALATGVAILHNFLLNDYWTFRAERHHRPLPQRLLRFVGVALGGLVITAVLVTVLTASSYLPLLVANLVAIGCATIWNYLVNSVWTWRKPRMAGTQSSALE